MSLNRSTFIEKFLEKGGRVRIPCGSMIDFKLCMETYIIVDILAITFDMIN